MPSTQNRKFLGIGLIAAGVLFLLVSNRIILRWEHIWPLFLVLGGGVFLRDQRARRIPELLFAGVSSLLLGVFLLLFSTNILAWEKMGMLWPTIPLIAGLALLATSVASRERGPSVVVGAAILGFAVIAFFLETGAISSRVSEPFVRFWPLVLIIAGIVILRMARPATPPVDPDMQAVREIIGDDDKPSVESDRTIAPGVDSAILKRVRAADGPDEAVTELVQGLKANFPRFSWVGVYRRQGDTLTLGETDYVGATPEYQTIKLEEGICGACAREEKTIIVPDVCADDRYLACSPTVKSEIVVPLVADGAVVGVLDIDSDELDAFADADRSFLESLVSRAMPFIRETQALA